jgi:D-alanyl-D-alanine carboxypeptidase/D-alanyl-D-alanine-endopeptidase (penicillin-binding protein 4)
VAEEKAPTREEKVERLFEQWVAQPELAGASVGFCLIDENGTMLYASPIAEHGMCPASTLKTVTTGAAFGLLGTEFHFETTLAGTSPIGADGNLPGDLVLVGGGDPTFSQDDLNALADAAVVAGLKSVSGKLAVDTSVFPDDPMNEFWNWGDVGNAYGAGAYGVNLDHNRIDIVFEPAAEVGAPAKFLSGGPVPKDVKWVNHVTTGPAGSGDQVVVYSEPYGRTITLRGTVPAGEKEFAVKGANPDPPALAMELLRPRLEGAGVKFSEEAGPFPTDQRTTLATHQSAALPEIIDHLHRVSDNLEAQSFFITMGNQQNADPRDVVQDYWEMAGVRFVGLRLLDGSGLSRATMIRPIDLARINRAARGGPHGERFYQSLSTYENGTIRSKLGSMSGVKTEVGFLKVAEGKEFTFALMANGLDTSVKFWPMGRALLAEIRELGW